MPRVKIAREAREELREAARWYEEQIAGLGRQLLDSVHLVIRGIGESPLRFAVVHRDVRRALVARFPYGVFYRIADDGGIVVLAILHLARDPSRWIDR
jgi:plasmid stabilization system protein ParE